MAVASCAPTVQAFGWRAQKPSTSWTVAEAADTASEAPTVVDGPRCPPPIGNSISTRPSQNVIRTRKNMSPAFPTANFAEAGRKLAGSIESAVLGVGSILPIIEQNTPQIFA